MRTVRIAAQRPELGPPHRGPGREFHTRVAERPGAGRGAGGGEGRGRVQAQSSAPRGWGMGRGCGSAAASSAAVPWGGEGPGPPGYCSVALFLSVQVRDNRVKLAACRRLKSPTQSPPAPGPTLGLPQAIPRGRGRPSFWRGGRGARAPLFRQHRLGPRAPGPLRRKVPSHQAPWSGSVTVPSPARPLQEGGYPNTEKHASYLQT